tara:strand:+ start:1544 stop:1735 length:192 start_codon:yes stop_codon:yes gene_type:complete
MEFSTKNYGFNIQIIPTYGIALGFLYYNPNLEPDNSIVLDEDYYDQLTLLFIIFGLHITWWRL